MNGEYLSLETAKEINNLKKSRDNLVESALQMDKIVNEKQQMIEKLQKELTEEKNAYIKMYNMYDEEKKKNESAIELLEYVNEIKIKFTNYNSKEKDYIDTLLETLKGSDKE